MILLKLSLCISLAISPTLTFALVEKTIDEDILKNVSVKLNQIENYLKDNRISISSSITNWHELDKFESKVMFVLAHDPHGSPQKDIDQKLSPSYLTQTLKQDWAEVQNRAEEIPGAMNDPEWAALKIDIEQFFKYRDAFLYQHARAIIKSGVVSSRIVKIKENTRLVLKEQNTLTQVTFKVIDPLVEKMGKEIEVLNQSVSKLVALRTPPPSLPINNSIFQKKHLEELSLIAGISFVSGLLLMLFSFYIKQKLTVEVEEKNPQIENSFNYYDWLKRLEINLQYLKSNEENSIEKYIHLKNTALELSEARKKLNLADSQQDYYTSLEQLNATSTKIEELLDKVNLKQTSEPTRRFIRVIIQLCDAIENNRPMNMSSEKPNLTIIKQERAIKLNAA